MGHCSVSCSTGEGEKEAVSRAWAISVTVVGFKGYSDRLSFCANIIPQDVLIKILPNITRHDHQGTFKQVRSVTPGLC